MNTYSEGNFHLCSCCAQHSEQGLARTWSFWSLGWAEASCTSSFSHFPSQASFLHRWDSNLVLGIIGSSCCLVHDPYFTSEMPCVLFILFSVLGPWCHHWDLGWEHPSLRTVLLGVSWLCSETSAKEMPAESNAGAEPWALSPGMSPTQGKSDLSPCWEVHRQPGVALSLHLLSCLAPSSSCLLSAWSTPGLLVWGHYMSVSIHNPALNAQRLIKE